MSHRTVTHTCIPAACTYEITPWSQGFRHNNIVDFLFIKQNVAVGKFDFTVRLDGYQNPNNWRHTGTCCDNGLVNGTCKKCDTKIFFCLRRYGASLLTINDRTLSTTICHYALFETSSESLPRNIHINSSNPWPNDVRKIILDMCRCLG